MADNHKEPSLLQKIIVGTAAIGAGTYLGFRTGLFDRASSLILNEGRALSSAVARLRQESTPQGISRFIKPSALKQDLNTLRSYYNASLAAQKPKPFKIESLFEQRQRFFAEWGTSLDRSGTQRNIANFIDTSLAAKYQQGIIGKLLHQMTGYKQVTFQDAINNNLINRQTTQWISDMIRNNPQAARSIVDRGLFMSREGRIADLRGLAEIPERVMSFLEPGIIGKLGHFRDILSSKNAPEVFAIRGSSYNKIMQPFMLGNRALGTGEAYIYAGGKVADMFHPNKTLDGTYRLYSGRFGTVQRLGRRMFGMEGNPLPKKDTFFDKVINFLDIGSQDTPGQIEKFLSIYRKFGDKDWVGNVSRNLLNKNVVQPKARTIEQLDKMRSFYGSKTWPASQRVFNILTSHAGIQRYDVWDRESLLNTFRQLGSMPNSPLSKRWGEYLKNPEAVMDRIGIISSKLPFGRSTAISGEDILRKEIAEALISRIGTSNAREAIDIALQAGKISKSEALRTQDLISKVTFDTFYKRAKESNYTQESLNKIIGLFKGNMPSELRFQSETARMVNQYSGLFHYGPMMDKVGEGIARNTYNFGEYLAIKESPGFAQAVRDLVKANDITKLKSIIKSLNAGRTNYQDITTATLFPYYGVERLSEALSNINIPYIKNLKSLDLSKMSIGALRLGLGSQSTGNTADLFASLILKRVLPVAAGVTAFKYLSWEVGNLTGYSLEQRWERTKAQIMLDRATSVDAEDKREYQLRPGIDQLSGLPFVGWMFNEPRTYEEQIEYYKYGRDPVRKGRFWMLSRGAYTGGKIEYWQPNSYRMSMGEWQYTDTMYGEGGQEYWSHSWLPTPRYPLAPLNRILDPYWFERKHYHDRPYPVTGDFFESNTPWGVVLNPTIGQLIKPNIQMHRDQLAQINEDIKEWGSERNNNIYGVIMPSGNLEMRQVSWINAPEGIGGQELLGGPPPGSKVLSGGIGVYGVSDIPSSSGIIGSGAGSYITMDQLAAVNKRLATYKPGPKGIVPEGVLPVGGFWTPAQYDKKQINDMYLAQNVVDSTSIGMRLSDVQYVARELLGIYGFGHETLFGNPYEEQWVSERADVAYSMERRFWDQNIGGLGGMMSEIGRRFLPHRRHDLNYWNPIPNEMPDWMPGMDYFIDFQHGDPYSKIKMGEVRLPGAAYEATVGTHPDMFGEYGAFDRFRILADVAPYSQEFKLWRKIAGQTVTDPELREQMEQIKYETAQQKKKYRLYPYEFKDQEIAKEEVTIDKFIDPNTFLSLEYPETPIRLASVRLNKEHPLSEFISEGEQVTVGLEKNPRFRVREDTLGTMHAVIYDDGNNLNRMLLERGIGRDTHEQSAVGTYARFTESEIARGSQWEKIAHSNIPLISNKFMNVNSPLEYYEREIVYGKEWTTWQHPIESYIKPTLESSMHKDPISGAITMGVMGGIIGRMFGGTWKRAGWSSAIAAGIGFVGSMIRILNEVSTGETWIPKRRKEEREVNEYFDVLEYMKYRGLYQQAVEKAKLYDDVDIEAMIGTPEVEGEMRKARTRELKELKKELILEDRGVNKEEISAINKELNILKNYKKYLPLTPWTIEALKWHSKMESTLYGGDPSDYSSFLSALPSKDREFAQYFVNEQDPAKQRKILSLVPENQRRYYQAMWGQEPDERPSLTDYFDDHYLPDPSWKGWDPSVNLDSIKLKFIKNEALDMSEFNMWPEDEKRAANTPVELGGHIGDSNVNPFALQSAIENVLNGRGLKNVKVTFMQVPGNGVDINMNIEHDRSAEIEEYMRNNFADIIG